MVGRLKLLMFMYHTRRYGEALGGAERRAFQFSSFAAPGIETHFLEKKPGIGRFYSSQPTHTVGIPNSSFRLSAHLEALIWSILATASAFRLNRRYKFNLLASHDPEYWNVLPMLLASVITGLPCVAYLHHVERANTDKPVRNFMDFYAYFRAMGYRKISALISAVEKILSIALLNRLNGLLAVSDATKRDFVSRGIHERKIFSVTNGIDVGYLTNFRNPNKVFDCVYFGRISPRKGLDDLFYVFNRIHRKALLIGGGNPKHVEHYAKLFRQLPNIEFSGYLPDREAYPLIASSKIFVFPSYEEGFGLVVGEAIALGLAVVCYDVPALVEVWDEIPQFVRTGDREALAEEVRSLLDGQGKLDEMIRDGLNSVSKYDWPSLVPRELRVLKSLAGRGDS